MKMKIISNMYGLENIKREDVKVSLIKYPKGNNSFSTIMKYFLKSFNCDYMVINCVRDIYILSFLKSLIPFGKCKLILLDLILTIPSQALTGRISKRIKSHLLKSVDVILVYSKSNEKLCGLYEIGYGKVGYIPFKVNKYESIIHKDVQDGGYIFSGGKSRRDYQTLIKAMEGLPYPMKIIAPANEELKTHGTFIDSSSLPPNIEVIHDDGTPESFIDYIASSRLVVLPFKKDDIAPSGISVCLMAMGLRKCVIMSSGPATEGILTTNEAMIVPPEDATALRQTIIKAYEDERHRKILEKNGYEYAMKLGGEENLLHSIVDQIITRFHSSSQNISGKPK